MRNRKVAALAACATIAAAVFSFPAVGADLNPDCLPALNCSPSPTEPPPPPPTEDPTPTQEPQPTATSTQPTDPKKDEKPPPPPAGGGPNPGESSVASPAPAPSSPSAPAAASAPPPGAPAPPGAAAPALQVPVFPRTASRTTARLIEILQPAIDHGAIKPEELPAHFAPFPIAGLAYFSDDWGFPRYTPTPHLHEGTDVFADLGTPVVAYGPGTVRGMGDQAVGGLSVWVHFDDGNSLYYTHLSAFALGLTPGMRVDMGTLLAYVGNTGNASGGAHHVHLEVHPAIKNRDGTVVAGATTLPNGQASSNTPPTNPKPYLDAWLAQAEERATAFVGGLLQQYAEIPREAHISRRVNELFLLESVDRPGDLLWFSAAQPELGVLGLARQAAGEARLTSAVGSMAQRTREQQRLAAVQQAVQAPYHRMAAFTGMPSLHETGSSGLSPAL